MGLNAQQGIVFYSPQILDGEKLQGLIQKITPEFMSIIIPIGNITIDEGTGIYINFWDNNATYEFKSTALSTKNANENQLNITKPTTIAKIINRGFPRVDMKIRGEIQDFDNFQCFPCTIIDMSGGGLLVTTGINRENNSIMKFNFNLSNDEHDEQFIGVNGKIVWKKELDQRSFQYGIEFEKLSEIRRQKIISFVNEKIIKNKSA